MGLLDWLTDITGGSSGGNNSPPIPPGAIGNPAGDPNGMDPPASYAPSRALPPTPPGPAPTPIGNPAGDPNGVDPPASYVPPTPPMPPDPNTGKIGNPAGDPTGIEPPASYVPTPPAPPGQQYPTVAQDQTNPTVPTYPTVARDQNNPAVPPTPPVPPGAPTDISAAIKPDNPQHMTWLANALGIKTPEEARQAGKELSRGLAAAFSNAGNVVGKTKFSAFASGVGAGMTGAQKQEDKEQEDQRKYVQQKIQANTAESTAKVNAAHAEYWKEAAKAGMTQKNSVMNSDQQLFLRAQAGANQDQEVKSARTTFENNQKNLSANDPRIKQSEEAFHAIYRAKMDRNMRGVGLDPKKFDELGKEDGMTEKNPIPASRMSHDLFNALPPGAYFVNPKTKKLMIKTPPRQTQAAAPAPGTPPMPPAPPGASPVTTPGTPPAPGSQAAAQSDEYADAEEPG